MDSRSSLARNDKKKKINQQKSNPKVHRCNFCGRECPSPTHLEIHYRTHTKEKPFFCILCPFTTGHKQALRCHQRTHDPDTQKNYRCTRDNCKYAGTTMNNLKQHMKSHLETKDREFKCNFCPYTANIGKDLHDHIRCHTKEKPFKCKICLNSFSTQSYLKLHQDSFHFDGDYSERPFPCTYEGCIYRAKAKNLLKKHLETHGPICDKNKFKCEFPDCSKTFSTLVCLRRHQSLHFSTEKTFQCPVKECQYSTAAKRYLKYHMKVHSEERPFVCVVAGCSYKSKYSQHLRSHVRRIHQEEKDCEAYFCDLCDYTSKIKGYIRNHKQRAHVTSLFTCPFPDCEYKTSVKQDLNHHANMLHSALAIQYRCPQDKCSYSSPLKHMVNRHVKRVHGVKAKCPEPGCEYSTKDRANQAGHRRTVHRMPYGRKKVCGKDKKQGITTSECKATSTCEFRTGDAKEMAVHLLGQHDLPRVNLFRFD